MTERNCKRNAPRALPISSHPLVDVDQLFVLRRKTLESIFLAPVPGDEDVAFESPIQVVVLASHGEDVLLGVYAPSDWVLEEGTIPNAEWWPKDAGSDEQLSCKPVTIDKAFEIPVPDNIALSSVEKAVFEELDALAASQYVFYETVKGMLDRYETSQSLDWQHTQLGFAQWKDWLLERERRVRQLVKLAFIQTARDKSQPRNGG